MDTEKRVSKLRAVSLFKDLPEAELRRLAQGLTERSFQPGDVAVREGQPGDELFIILEGEFQAFLRQEALAFEKELRRLQPGEYFGEIALITGGKRLASVRAVTAGQALVLHRQHLHDLIGSAPAAALALCRGMADYVSQARQGQAAVAFVNLDEVPSLKEVHPLLPPRISAFCQALAIERDADRVKVALVNPQDEPTRTFLRDVLRQYQVEFVATSQRDFERYREQYLGRVLAPPGTGLESLTYVDPEGREQPLGQQDTAALMQDVFGQAVRFGASDLHFEPSPGAGRVRLRIDGKMLPLPQAVPHKLFNQLVSRLKVMSELDITVRRLPQDGRFALKAGSRQIEARVSVTPCQGGEKVVLRLLDPAQRKLELETLILSRPVCLLVREMFQSPSGLVLVCGPTGSGKTTTLYAGVNEVWKESQTVNIVTVEDPIEYQMEYATQIPINRAVGLDFPQILRTILRQDPDVILVGEIRDDESAAIALEAATTGHLVLSSLHTDFALEAIARLRNLQVKTYLLAGALRGVISQKLVPRVCKLCAQPVAADDEHCTQLKRIGILDASWTGTLYRGLGCEACRGEGEIGRVGVYEILAVNDRLRNLIEEEAPWTRMQQSLGSDVFIPMARYARFLLEEGVVAPERIREIFPAKRFSERASV